MAYQEIGLGSAADDGTGDTIRAGGDKINDNFVEIYTLLGTGTALSSGISATATVVTLASPVITGVLALADGSASAPSFTNDGDTNTGIYFSAADQVAISTGGTARLTVSSTAATFAGNIAIPDDGDIGSASATDAIQISSAGIVTFKDDILIKDAGTIGNASVAAVMTLASTGIVTFADDILIKDAGTIGSATSTEAISISSAGVVGFSATTEASATGTAAVTLAGGLGVAKDVWIGDDVVLDSDGAIVSFGDDQEIKLRHLADQGLEIQSTHDAPLVRRGEDVFIVLDQTAAAGTDAGDIVIMDRSAADGTDAGDDIIGEDEVFLHSGMQRNVINIRGSSGEILNSVAGFAPGAI